MRQAEPRVDDFQVADIFAGNLKVAVPRGAIKESDEIQPTRQSVSEWIAKYGKKMKERRPAPQQSFSISMEVAQTDSRRASLVEVSERNNSRGATSGDTFGFEDIPAAPVQKKATNVAALDDSLADILACTCFLFWLIT